MGFPAHETLKVDSPAPHPKQDSQRYNSSHCAISGGRKNFEKKVRVSGCGVWLLCGGLRPPHKSQTPKPETLTFFSNFLPPPVLQAMLVFPSMQPSAVLLELGTRAASPSKVIKTIGFLTFFANKSFSKHSLNQKIPRETAPPRGGKWFPLRTNPKHGFPRGRKP